ncbi:hypothetical protein J2754_003052 [Halarchaeum solikamskense]|nr:hypothetical protein [Halarchaeum solikamskense]MBP2252706.1 hypothetical protein [Halarchaeum solikamskense]
MPSSIVKTLRKGEICSRSFEVTSVKFASEILLSLPSNIVDTVAEVDEETVCDQRLAAGVDVLARKPDLIAVSHFLRGIGASFRKMLQNAVVGARHPVGVEAHNRLWLR